MQISEVSFTGQVTVRYNKSVVDRTVLNDLPPEILDIQLLRNTDEVEECNTSDD